MILRKLPENINPRCCRPACVRLIKPVKLFLTFSDVPHKWKLKAAVQLDGRTVAVVCRAPPAHLCPGWRRFVAAAAAGAIMEGSLSKACSLRY